MANKLLYPYTITNCSNYVKLAKAIGKTCDSCTMSLSKSDKCTIITPEPIPQELIESLRKQGVGIEANLILM